MALALRLSWVDDLSRADYERLVGLLAHNTSRSIEAMGVMLAAMKRAGWHDFDACWSNAIQRIRVQPYMDDDEADELLADKELLNATKPAYRAAFNGEPMPKLGGNAESDSADFGIADH